MEAEKCDYGQNIPYLYTVTSAIAFTLGVVILHFTLSFMMSFNLMTDQGVNTIRTASADSVEFREIRPRMYIEDLLW